MSATLTMTDLFAGGGGTSTGAVMAGIDVRAVGRFNPDHPTTFTHRLLPGVLFPTREAAWDAGCAEMQRLTPTDPMGTGNLLEEL